MSSESTLDVTLATFLFKKEGQKVGT